LRQLDFKNLTDAGIRIQTVADFARPENITPNSIYIPNSAQERVGALEKM
jgi:hypothetical protein